ncbi:MAG: GlxA family transcriptional regulator [Panacagrimonas sp.]
MPSFVQPARIGIVEYPGAQRAAVHGLTDLFETAARLQSERDTGPTRLAVKHYTRLDCSARAVAPLAALILPPSLVGTPTPEEAAPFVPWIKAHHQRGARVCSVCAGAFLLAETGLLDGRSATTHWVLAEAFAQRFPHVQLDVAKLLIDEDDVLTAGGVMAWIDLGLRLIERLIDPATMLATARMFLVDPAGREQRYYSSPSPRIGHGDDAILAIQQWLHVQSGSAVTVTAMASKAGLGERTFLRRFQGATGQTPTSYLQHLRVARARELLELSRQAIDEVAWKVGYEDPSAFRKIFRRIVGLSPGAYRQRFSAGRLGAASPSH